MDNREIAERLSELSCERNGKTALAARLFILSSFLYGNGSGYTMKEMETDIFEYLEANRKEKK
jgi:hypothetical protein